MNYPEFPVALGVIRAVKATTYDVKLEDQIEKVKAGSKIHTMNDLLYSGNVWSV